MNVRPEMALREIGPQLINSPGIRQKMYMDGRSMIWRFSDEPGCWRLGQQGEFIPAKDLAFYGIPADELKQRQLRDDQARVRDHISQVTSQAHHIASRQGYELRGNGSGLFSVHAASGVELTPGPVSEKVAQEILLLLAPDQIHESLAETLAAQGA